MWSERTIPSGIAALIVATVPLWILLLDGLRPGGQPWTARVWIGTLVGLVGVALVARPEGGVLRGPLAGRPRPCRSRALSWTVGSLYAQSLRSGSRSSPRPRSRCWRDRWSSSSSRGSSARTSAASARASSDAWGALVYLVVFGSLVGFTAFAYCLNELPATTVGTYAYVNPVVAVALGALILGEPLSPGPPRGRRADPGAPSCSRRSGPTPPEGPRQRHVNRNFTIPRPDAASVQQEPPPASS